MIKGLENVTKADSARSTKVDCTAAVEEYINKSDWRIKANANTGFSAAGLVNNLAGKVIANYWFDKVYTKREGDAHRNGDYHIHDADILGAYCCGHDLQRLLKEGFNGVDGRVDSRAPKHLREALQQMANFIGILQSEWAGAQAFSSFDTFLAPIAFYDIFMHQLSYDDIKKAVRNFIYNVNVPSRWGQSPFSNVTIDLKCPEDLKTQLPMRNIVLDEKIVEMPFFMSIKNECTSQFEKAESILNEHKSPEEITPDELECLAVCYRWNAVMDELRKRINPENPDSLSEDEVLYSATYSLFEPEIKIMFKAYYEVMNEGDSKGQPFTFPIPTLNITEDFDWDNPDYDVVWENTARYGSSYFQNFIGSQYLRDENGKLTIRDENAYSPKDLRSMCCRLSLDRKALRKRGGGLFGSDAQTGSIGVVTINMARLGYLYKGNIKGLMKRLYQLMDMAKSTLEKKREVVKLLNERGLFPYTKRYIRTFDTFFSTIGVNGMNECIRNFSNDKNDITDATGQVMAMTIMEKIRERLTKYQEETGNLYNLEATPAEGCLTYDTQVLTIDGPVMIGQLCDKEVTLLSFNRETKKKEYKKAKVFLDSITEKIYKITLDNGLTIECTSEHPFAVRFFAGKLGEQMYWSPASALKVGDRLKSVYPRLSMRGYKKYGKDFFQHREKWSYYNGNIPEGYVIHHKDGNKLNNSVDNLEALSDFEHRSIHSSHLPKGSGFGEENNFYGKHHSVESKNKIFEAKTNYTEEEKTFIRECLDVDMTPKQIDRASSRETSCGSYVEYLCRNEDYERKEKQNYPIKNEKAIMFLYSKGFTSTQIADILRGYNKQDFVEDTILKNLEENHVVVSIEVINKKTPVYNATVEDNQNFYVGNEELGYVLTHNTTYRFAKEDIKRFPDIIQAGTSEAPYYTNSSQLPANFTSDIFEALDLQDDLQKMYTGGTVLHIYSQEDVDGQHVKNLIRKILSNYRLPYVSYTASFSICPKHGRISGLHEHCPLCDKEIIEKYTNE